MAAAKVIGNSDGRIIFRHILPNVISSIVVRATLGISTAILDTAALGFLGMGVQPPMAEWGDMLGRARTYIFSAPYNPDLPGIGHHPGRSGIQPLRRRLERRPGSEGTRIRRSRHVIGCKESGDRI